MLNDGKCYYEVLGTPRTSTIEEIRSSYKRKALQLHPDKNSHRLEEATREFAHLQHCYSVLNDPHERKWYDQHREQILHASKMSTGYEGQFLDTSDLMPYFSPASAFKGFSDHTDGFFAVYRNLFQRLEFFENQLLKKTQKSPDRIIVTSFGDSHTPFIPSLKGFYDKWTHFNTVRSFSEQSYASYTNYENREHRRYVEKEGKKEEDRRKKEYVTTIRSLALFIKKRDPRYQHWLRLESEKKSASMQTKSQHKPSRGSSSRTMQSDDILWRTTEEKDAYESFFAMYAEEYLSDASDADVEDSSFIQNNEIYQCVACSKSFKSESQWNNHEKSKKHQKNAFQLKKKMLKDEDMWKTYLKQSKTVAFEEKDKPTHLDDKYSNHNSESESDSEKDAESSTDTVYESDESGFTSGSVDHSSISYFSSDVHSAISHEGSIENMEDPEPSTIELLDSLYIASDEDVASMWKKDHKPPKVKTKSMTNAQPSQRETKNTAKGKGENDASTPHHCNTCKASFPSRNALFRHLKRSCHQRFK